MQVLRGWHESEKDKILKFIAVDVFVLQRSERVTWNTYCDLHTGLAVCSRGLTKYVFNGVIEGKEAAALVYACENCAKLEGWLW